MGKRILTIVFATLMAMVTFTACSDNDEHRNDTQTGEEQVDQLIDQLILNIAQMRVNEKNGEFYLPVSSKDEAYRFCESLTGEKWDGKNRTVTLADAYGTVMLKASSVEGLYGTVIFRAVRHLDDMTLHLADPEFIKNDNTSTEQLANICVIGTCTNPKCKYVYTKNAAGVGYMPSGYKCDKCGSKLNVTTSWGGR
jgi:hypothetical protein